MTGSWGALPTSGPWRWGLRHPSMGRLGLPGLLFIDSFGVAAAVKASDARQRRPGGRRHTATLRQDFAYHARWELVCEAFAEAVAIVKKLAVLQAEQMQNRGVEVV